MIKLKHKAISLILAVLLIVTSCPVVLSVANASEGSIIIHYYSETQNPYVYYWNSLPENLVTDYPGVAMTADVQQGDNWYSYTFEGCTKINMLFTYSDGSQVTGKELTRNTGEWWYKNNHWYDANPDNEIQEKTDFREETVYRLIITRFFDGDSGNNVHCWYDGQAGNQDSDPAWRGDFKGLVEKLDYIKALGFSAVSLTPVAQNAYGYDYNGWYTVNFKEIDSRYESDGYTYEDLVNACHNRGIKVIQEVTLSTGSFGETNLCPIFEVNEYADAYNPEQRVVPTGRLLDAFGLQSADDYWNQDSDDQYQQRLNMLINNKFSDNSNSTGLLPEEKDYDIGKLSDSAIFNPLNRFYSGYFNNFNNETWSKQFGHVADDMVDLNTENPYVGQYLAEAMKMYAEQGVDAVYINSANTISSLSLEVNIIKPLKEMLEEEHLSMEIFGQIDSCYNGVWYNDQATLSAPFYTWSKADDELISKWRTDETAEAINNNMNMVFDFIKENNEVSSQLISNNAFLDGITYHNTDYTKKFINVQDSPMMYNFGTAQDAFQIALNGDKYYNDATWNMTMYQNYDYTHDGSAIRSNQSTQEKAEKLCLMFTFRGIPAILYGDEVEFKKGSNLNVGFEEPLENTGHAYYGDYLEGDVTATDYSEYTASGTAADTLSSPLSKHISKLNAMRRAIPALQKGQYTTDSNYVDGDMAFIRRYTNVEEEVDSLALVTISGGATFKNIPNGTYIDAVTGDVQLATNGTLTVSNIGKANMRIYVCCTGGFTGIDGQIGSTSDYLKCAGNISTYAATTENTNTTETMSPVLNDVSLGTGSNIIIDESTEITINAGGGNTGTNLLFYKYIIKDPDGNTVNTPYYSLNSTFSIRPESPGKYMVSVYVQGSNNSTASKIYMYNSIEGQKNQIAGWKKNATGWWYDNGDGTYPKSEWKSIDGSWYYFNASGYIVTGWFMDGGNRYYLETSGKMATGWKQIDGKWYFLESNGKMAANKWVNTNYYVKADGVMATDEWVDGDRYYVDADGKWVPNKTKAGWKQNATGWWYDNGDSTYPKSEWKSIDGSWYYFNASGYIVTGWFADGGSWYYFDSNGKMATGWKEIDGKWYFLESNGKMAANKWINGIYYMKSDGKMAVSEWVDNGKYYVGADGKWVPGKTK